MDKHKKRSTFTWVITVLLVISMVLSTVIFPAFATETEKKTGTQAATEEAVEDEFEGWTDNKKDEAWYVYALSSWSELGLGGAAGSVKGSGAQIVAVAAQEVGYTEGRNKDTKYGEWYGLNNNEWCAMFLAWCANECGYGTDICPKIASCTSLKNWFIGQGLWHDRDGYTPKIGDYILFERDSCGGADHVGIVESVSGGKAHTIEGNSGGQVKRHSYDLNNSAIAGYGSPRYPAVAGSYTGNSPEELAQYIFTYLTANGFTAQAACGVIGNLEQECGLDISSVLREADGVPYGMFQLFDERKQKLLALPNHDTAEVQLDYFLTTDLPAQEYFFKVNASGIQPVNGKRTEGYKVLTCSAGQCAKYFADAFERCGNDGSISKRMAYADKWYNRFAG